MHTNAYAGPMAILPTVWGAGDCTEKPIAKALQYVTGFETHGLPVRKDMFVKIVDDARQTGVRCDFSPAAGSDRILKGATD